MTLQELETRRLRFVQMDNAPFRALVADLEMRVEALEAAVRAGAPVPVSQPAVAPQAQAPKKKPKKAAPAG